MSRIIKGAVVDGAPLVLELKKKFNQTPDEENTITPEEQADALLEEANRRAAEIVNEARREADELLEKARAEAEEIKVAAQQQGYQDALQQAEDEAAEIRRRAREVLNQAEEFRRQTLEAMEQEIISLGVEIAEKYIAAQLKLEPDTIVAVAQEAIQLVKDRERVTVYVNPDELPVYMEKKQQLEQSLSDRTTLVIIAAPQVKPGGCLVDTDRGTVDATADARWQEILKAIYPS
ncbi:flagellar assembly protein FliH [Desulfohalotomaculum tongense]|uniref:FliH/SctL family protein n=1 Tax=Desulforadius tongensis TaxID=1216062 RepID=UPI001957F28B|nr:FliH/SctL family protein [Desulforadius tongensis]MBM7854211.1 flagellar assembly protein FliH [Desulforadius tongensis]